MDNILVVIPAYNESKAIGAVVAGIIALKLPVVVIDDGSKDNTSEAARSAGATVIRHAVNKGKGAALRTGFSHALKAKYNAVVVMDGDGQHRPEDISNFINAQQKQNAAMVIGNRMADIRRMPFVRIQTNRFMSFLISAVCGRSVPDTQCGFRLIIRAALEKMWLTASNYEIESEMIIEAARKGFTITSTPIQTIYEGGKSGIHPVVDTMRFFAFLFKILTRRQW